MSSKTFPAPGDVIAVLLVTDAQQSVLAGLRSQGRATAAYTAYGFHPEQDAPGSAICYAGQRPMPDTGHYLLGNGYRAFNTVLMRFNAPDSLSPFGRGGLNAYAYCEGDPINRIDPSGHVVSLLRGIAASFLRPGQRPLARGNALRISRYPLIAVGGAGAMPTDSSSGFVGGVLDVARKSLFARTGTPSMVPESGRTVIQQGLAALSSGDEFTGFTRRLEKVNTNLISHNDSHLSQAHGASYVDIAKRVEYGRTSNTTAHLEAARIWSGVDGPAGVVGTVFNTLGSLAGAADDHFLLKTGQALRRVTPPTSPTGKKAFDIRKSS
jgi:RHS repeat-associated protein